jgi:hypothetical protein
MNKTFISRIHPGASMTPLETPANANVAKAGRLLSEELARRGWDEGELAKRRKADREKLIIAERLRSETTMRKKNNIKCGTPL